MGLFSVFIISIYLAYIISFLLIIYYSQLKYFYLNLGINIAIILMTPLIIPFISFKIDLYKLAHPDKWKLIIIYLLLLYMIK